MNPETVTITEELLDEIVNLLTTCPYRDAQPVLQRLNTEYSEQTPKIQLN